jgi:hypothetical protein
LLRLSDVPREIVDSISQELSQATHKAMVVVARMALAARCFDGLINTYRKPNTSDFMVFDAIEKMWGQCQDLHDSIPGCKRDKDYTCDYRYTVSEQEIAKQFSLYFPTARERLEALNWFKAFLLVCRFELPNQKTWKIISEIWKDLPSLYTVII